jgi:peptidoglycan/xylan/chitin deacetylase (PgdA/CDA1 family)
VGTVKERLRSLASRFFVRSGVTRIGRRMRDHRGTLIFYGHRVRNDDEAFFQALPPDWLREQLAYITRHYEVISLTTLVTSIEEKRQPPPRSVVLTFDDGFRDNVEHALPLLDAFGVTATVFLVTGSLSDGQLPWSQRLGFLFERTGVSEVQHDLLGPEPVGLPDATARRQAYARAKRSLTSFPHGPRDAVIAQFEGRLGVEAPRDRMMTWDHARHAMATGHEMGAHTYSHALLAQITPTEARWEMERSRFDVQEHLGVRHPAFCFPAGSTNPGLRMLARDLGFRSAFKPGGRQRLNRPGDVDAFSLVRVGLPNAPAVQLEAEVDGPFHALRRIAGIRARADER